MDWKPDNATLKSWGPSDQWPERYFEWLRDKRPLPTLPPGPIEDQHRMYQPMLRMLRDMLNSEDETLEAFWAGRFKTFIHFDCHDIEADRRIAREKHSNDAYRALVEEMLRYTGPVDERLMTRYIERIDEARPYMGPMA